MKSILFATALLLGTASTSHAQLILTNVFDGQAGSPQGVELYVGADGSYDGWTLDLQFNGGSAANGNDFQTGFTFDSTVFSLGDYIYVTSTPADATLTAETGTIFESVALAINGDDRVRLTDGMNVIDQYGVTDIDGTGLVWDYTTSFASRLNGTDADGNFTTGDWSFSPAGSLNSGNGALANALGTFTTAIPEPSSMVLLGLAGLGMGLVRRRKA